MLIDVTLDKAYALMTGGPTILVSTRSQDGRDDVMACAWNTLFNMDPTQVIVVFDLEHDSTKNILVTGQFSISIPGDALKAGLLKAGSVHLREITEDKFDFAGLEKLPSRVIGAPLVKGAIGYLECRLMDRDLFERTGIALAEVVSARVEEDYWDGSSLVCEGQKEQTMHSAGSTTFFPRGHVQPWGRRR